MVRPLELAASEPLPIPIERLESSSDAGEAVLLGSSPRGSSVLGSSPRRSLKEQASQHTAPYQALPVQGPFLPEHTQTPEYAVLEPDEVCTVLCCSCPLQA